MSKELKTSLAWITSFLLIFAAWTAQYQLRPVADALIIGILGTLLIFCAEFIYSYRKKGHITFGSVRTWLRLHITAGIAGPLVILWHTGLNFHGFAGWLTLLTFLVLLSGFIGRYIYRQIPRTIKGRELSLRELDEQKREIEEHLRREIGGDSRAGALIDELRARFPLLAGMIAGGPGNENGGLRMLKLAFDWHRGRASLRRIPAETKGLALSLAEQLTALELERLSLVRRVSLLKTSKRYMAGWKTLHIPLTLSLFVGILIHMGGVFYYGRVLP